LARSCEIRSGQDESPSRFYASCDPSIILLTRHKFTILFIVFKCSCVKEDKTLLTQTETQQQKNGRGERIESSYVLLITI